jgi:hypothetical protein
VSRDVQSDPLESMGRIKQLDYRSSCARFGSRWTCDMRQVQASCRPVAGDGHTDGDWTAMKQPVSRVLRKINRRQTVDPRQALANDWLFEIRALAWLRANVLLAFGRGGDSGGVDGVDV